MSTKSFLSSVSVLLLVSTIASAQETFRLANASPDYDVTLASQVHPATEV